MSDLAGVKATLEGNRAKLAEISSDINDLKNSVSMLQATNGELRAKVDELNAQMPNSNLIAEIVQLVGTEATQLDSIAAQHTALGTAAEEASPTPAA